MIEMPDPFAPADAGWRPPTPAELRTFLEAHGGCHPDGRPRTAWLAQRLGLGKRGDRTVRGWLAGERNGQPVTIPYSTWYTLVELLAPGTMRRQ